MLNAQQAWDVFDDEFNAEDFFLCIVGLFESNPENPWCISTLQWWNVYAFIDLCHPLPCLREIQTGFRPCL